MLYVNLGGRDIRIKNEVYCLSGHRNTVGGIITNSADQQLCMYLHCWLHLQFSIFFTFSYDSAGNGIIHFLFKSVNEDK